eukprot:IDg17259t1
MESPLIPKYVGGKWYRPNRRIRTAYFVLALRATSWYFVFVFTAHSRSGWAVFALRALFAYSRVCVSNPEFCVSSCTAVLAMLRSAHRENRF